MLKWTASAQKLHTDTSVTLHTPNDTLTTLSTPCLTEKKRHKRRATIANKENIPILTSTPMIHRTRNSPLALAPLAAILNITPESISKRTETNNALSNIRTASTRRRHSSVGFTQPQIPQYAATLPRYEEEYSPSTVLPTGQQLALRGLLPDPFMNNPRYFTTSQAVLDSEQKVKTASYALLKKRKLEQEFVDIAAQEESEIFEESKHQHRNKKDLNYTAIVSNKMGDQTLDKLIDDILDSARKEEKKKKPRKSFNLRRRTLLKNQVEQQQETILSPSYAAGDDPCSDLSFLNCQPVDDHSLKLLQHTIIQPATPRPTSPAVNTPRTRQLLLQLPTPPKHQDSVSLDTPVRSKCKRRSESTARPDTNAKKYKADSGNYFEIGLALPSIYV